MGFEGVTVTSNTLEHLKRAKERGYFVTRDGRMFGPRGELNPSITGGKTPARPAYYRFSLNPGAGRWGWGERGDLPVSVRVHQLQAYQKYGRKILGKTVRHRDGNSLNNSYKNIVIGTQKENVADRPLFWSPATPKGRRDRPGAPPQGKLTDKQVCEARRRWEKMYGKRWRDGKIVGARGRYASGYLEYLAGQYGLNRLNMSQMLRGVTYRNVRCP